MTAKNSWPNIKAIFSLSSPAHGIDQCVCRGPLYQTGNATSEYEDFMTGFVVDNGHVWRRAAGITVAPDGSLLVTDDGSKSIWRITYTGK